MIVLTIFSWTFQGLYMAHKSTDVMDSDCKRRLESIKEHNQKQQAQQDRSVRRRERESWRFAAAFPSMLAVLRGDSEGIKMNTVIR
jgi:hypothetical protein